MFGFGKGTANHLAKLKFDNMVGINITCVACKLLEASK
jgi:hypothetical protein